MSEQFKNKVALVTGGATGIGRACALAFAQRGARVVVADIAVGSGQETVQLIKTANGEAFFYQCDVADSAAVQALVNATVQTYGRLDYACNNAGIEGVSAMTAEYAQEIWDKVIAVNLSGVWLCMKYQIPPMLKQGNGAIVNMASILGLVGLANAPAYTAAKHGVIGLTKTAAIEYASHGIRINAVCPGFVTTPMLERGGIREGTELYTTIAGLHPVKRLGTPEEVANAVAWLCSDEASFVTGIAMPVDGGYVAR